jgi:L,D-transpeptidase ErfK/SrfK
MSRLFYLQTTIVFCIYLGGVLSLQPAYGSDLLYRQGVGGTISIHTVKDGDSLVELARQFDIGYNEIAAANRGVDQFVPEVGTRVIIPGKWILPDVQIRNGIVINLAEMRLYYFHPHTKEAIETFPVGIGDEGWDTPTGAYRIIEKIVNPSWHVPASIKAQKPYLPDIVPSGPDNPLGTHALRLSIGTVLIHGTDRPYGIGRRVSHGCIHLYPEDIVQLFGKVRVGTKAVIVRQQVKAAIVENRVLVEIHADGSDDDLEREAMNVLEKKKLLSWADLGKLKTALRANSGIPTDITRN